jgi:hypothetical protein
MEKSISLRLKIKLLPLFAAFMLMAFAAYFDFSLIKTVQAESHSPDNVNRILILPPDKGVYLGQHPGESIINGVPRHNLKVFESAIARKAALWIQASYGGEGENDPPVFDVGVANWAWQSGYLVLGWAYEATPQHGRGRGFTVDKLLNGRYDKELKALAKQFREFGKPLIFSTAREPNGVLSIYMGGFGPNGDKDFEWAKKNDGLTHFNPSLFPNNQLYAGLGKPDVCDGLERLAAAQRYYYDFFVNRENLEFINFDSMGWAILPELTESFLIKKCTDFEGLYPGNQYVDWVTVNFYRYKRVGLQEDLKKLDRQLKNIQSVAPGKPILFSELGLFPGNSSDLDATAGEIQTFFNYILTKHPEIKGFSLWGDAFEEGYVANRQVRPNTPAAIALRKIITENPEKFHSCVRFSKGYRFPHCSNTPASETMPDD